MPSMTYTIWKRNHEAFFWLLLLFDTAKTGGTYSPRRAKTRHRLEIRLDGQFMESERTANKLRRYASTELDQVPHLNEMVTGPSSSNRTRLASLPQVHERLQVTTMPGGDSLAYVPHHRHPAHAKHEHSAGSAVTSMHSGGGNRIRDASFNVQQVLLLCVFAGAGSFVSFSLLYRYALRANSRKAGALKPLPPGKVTSLPWIWCLTTSQIPYGFMVSNMTLMMFPVEAKKLFPASPSCALGGLFLLIAISMAFGPIAGQISDSLKHPLGRRRPAILLGSQLILFCTCGMWLCSLKRFASGYCAMLLCQQVIFQSVSTVMMAVLSDIVEQQSMPVGSGIQLANTLLGAVLGIFCFDCLAVRSLDYRLNYGMLLLLVVLMLPFQMLATKEADSSQFDLPHHLDWSQPLHAIRAVYTLDLETHPTFDLILKERSFYFAGISAKAYTLYFIRDVLHLNTLAEQSTLLSRSMFLAECIAACIAILVATLCERGIVNAQPTAVVGLCIMGVSCQLEICSIIPTKELKQQAFMLLAICFSIGQAMYLTGELAVVIQRLPNRKEASKLLGLAFGLSTAVGGGIGSIVAAVLLEAFGKIIPESMGLEVKPGTYKLSGYTIVLLTMLVSLLIAAILLAFVSKGPPVDLDRAPNGGSIEAEPEAEEEPEASYANDKQDSDTSKRPSAVEANAGAHAV